MTEFWVERQTVGIGWKVDPVPISKEDDWKYGKERYSGEGKRSWSAAIKAILYRSGLAARSANPSYPDDWSLVTARGSTPSRRA